MNTRKIIIIALGAVLVFALTLAAALFFMREAREGAPLADLSLQSVISRCEAALDEFTPGAGNPPQRVCKVEEGIIRVLASDRELDSEIKPGDTITISLNLAGILQGQLINVLTGDAVAKPSAQTRLCFATYPLWSFSPAPVFDSALKDDNYVCSNPLLLSEFPEKVSFTIQIPSQDFLALDPMGQDAKMYGVTIFSVPDRFLHGITKESLTANHESFPPIYLLWKPIVLR